MNDFYEYMAVCENIFLVDVCDFFIMKNLVKMVRDVCENIVIEVMVSGVNDWFVVRMKYRIEYDFFDFERVSVMILFFEKFCVCVECVYEGMMLKILDFKMELKRMVCLF